MGLLTKSAAAFGAALLLLAPSAYAAEPLQGKPFISMPDMAEKTAGPAEMDCLRKTSI